MKNLSMTPPEKLSDWLRLRRLYVRAFPREERKPFFVILGMYRRGNSDMWCIRERGRVTGLAFTVNSPRIILLDYLAVDARCREKGVGTWAMGRLMEHYRDRGLVVEIESTLEKTPDIQQRQRRKAFYEHCGMVSRTVEAEVFGVRMELMEHNCSLSFEDYRNFYRDHISAYAAERVLPVQEEEELP